MKLILHYSFFIPSRVVVSDKFRSIFMLTNSKNNRRITYTWKEETDFEKLLKKGGTLKTTMLNWNGIRMRP